MTCNKTNDYTIIIINARFIKVVFYFRLFAQARTTQTARDGNRNNKVNKNQQQQQQQ